jgi:hypothetical protein
VIKASKFSTLDVVLFDLLILCIDLQNQWRLSWYFMTSFSFRYHVGQKIQQATTLLHVHFHPGMFCYAIRPVLFQYLICMKHWLRRKKIYEKLNFVILVSVLIFQVDSHKRDFWKVIVECKCEDSAAHKRPIWCVSLAVSCSVIVCWSTLPGERGCIV